MALITVDNLSAFYENKEVFGPLSFRVEQGDYLCIAGENGSGKTTLMRCLLGLSVKHTGAVLLNGFTRSEIGWLPQRTEAQKDFPASAWEVVMSAFASSGFFGIISKRENAETAYRNMERLGIAALKNCSFKELSGGQQQKVLLCRALCSAGKVLLLDEPVTGLDCASQDEMYSLINGLNSEGMTVIMISHDVGRASGYANKVLHLAFDGYFFGNASDYHGHHNCGSKGVKGI